MCKPTDADWSLCGPNDPILTLDSSTMSLSYQGPINRLGAAGPVGTEGWFRPMAAGTPPVPADFSPAFTVPGERTYHLSSYFAEDDGTSTASYRNADGTDLIPVEGGAVLFFAAYCAVHRCGAYLEIEFVDDRRQPVAIRPGIAACRRDVVLETTGGTDIRKYDRCVASATVPAEARFARLRIVKGETIVESDSFMFFVRPYLSYSPAPAVLPAAHADSEFVATLFERHAADVFVYRFRPPLAFFNGTTAAIHLAETRDGRSDILASARIDFPLITGAEIAESSRRIVSGSIFAEANAGGALPLALCRPDRGLIARGWATWDGKTYRFAFVLPQDPFSGSASVRAFSLYDAGRVTKLLDFSLSD